MKEFSGAEHDFSKLKIEDFLMDNGKHSEVYCPEKPRDRLVFASEHCEFKPVGWIRTDWEWLPLGYKVVTMDWESLGLRNNPTPMKFPIGEWVFEERELQYGDKDYGGIWTALEKVVLELLKSIARKPGEWKREGF